MIFYDIGDSKKCYDTVNDLFHGLFYVFKNLLDFIDDSAIQYLLSKIIFYESVFLYI